MVTPEREYLNFTKRLRDIEVITLSDAFENYKIIQLDELRKECQELIVKIGGRDHDYSFQTTVSRINSKIDDIKTKERFRMQIIISSVILIVGLGNLVIQIYLKF